MYRIKHRLELSFVQDTVQRLLAVLVAVRVYGGKKIKGTSRKVWDWEYYDFDL